MVSEVRDHIISTYKINFSHFHIQNALYENNLKYFYNITFNPNKAL